MPYTTKTMRKLPPTARKLAGLHNDAYRLSQRLKALVDAAFDLELNQTPADLKASLCSWCGRPSERKHKCDPKDIEAAQARNYLLREGTEHDFKDS